MRIVYVIGSPKKHISTSAALLGSLEERLQGQEANWVSTSGVTAENVAAEAAKAVVLLEEAQALVIAFPLYVDGIPSHLLRFLESVAEALQTDETLSTSQPLRVYGIINCGFFEPEQAENAATMLELWCAGIGLPFSGAVLVGGGGMGKHLARGKGPGRNVGLALGKLAARIEAGEDAGLILARPNFPRKLYILAGHRGWVRAAKRRGLKKRDLYAGPGAKRSWR
jgi:hypothetical protein